MTRETESIEDAPSIGWLRVLLRAVLVVIALTAGVAVVLSARSTGERERVAVPKGDYAEICRLIEREAAALGKAPDLEQLGAFYATVDLEALLAVAPKGLQPSIEVLIHRRPEVLEILREAQGGGDAAGPELPSDFIDAIQTAGTVATDRCLDGSP